MYEGGEADIVSVTVKTDIHVVSAATEICVLSADDGAPVRGVTSLGDELYVIHCRQTDQIDVYSKSDFAFLRRFSVPGLSQHGIEDMTSCPLLDCLLIADSERRCLHKINRDHKNTTAIWRLSHKPHGLSEVSCWDDAVVLVACLAEAPLPQFNIGKVLELNAAGKCVRECVLQRGIESLWHAAELGFCNYVICYKGCWCARGEKIGKVRSDGEVQHCYGDWWIPGDRQLLRGACHMAVDDFGFVFVADTENSRLVLLNPSLEFVRSIATKTRPRRLHLEKTSRRLFVGHDYNAVSIIQL